MVFILAFILGFAFYLFLTAGSGTVAYFWSQEEIIMGAFLSALVGVFASRAFPKLGIEPGYKALNPKRWLLFIAYAGGPFFLELAKANLEIAYHVITGKARPGIVKIEPKLKGDFANALLANSITLTPGTLTVEIGEKGEFYVHWLNVESEEPSIEQVCGSFARWVRRITE